MSNDRADPSDGERGDQSPVSPGDDSSFGDLLDAIVRHVETDGTESLEALVAESESVESVEEFLDLLREYEEGSEEASDALRAVASPGLEPVLAAAIGDGEGTEAAVPDRVLPELDGLGDVSNVLVLAPARSDAEDAVCRSLLTHPSPAEQNVLLVALTGTADDRIESLQEGADRLPANVTVVSGREGVDSTTTTSPEDGAGPPTTIAVESMPDPSNLPRLGMTLSECVTGWEAEGETVVCFDSLTALLQYAGRQRVFQFVQVLQNRLTTVGATTHYHMDPAAHDDQTLATLRPLFDAVVEVSPEGEVEVVP